MDSGAAGMARTRRSVMVRSIVVAGILGASVAAAAVYTSARWMPQNPLGASLAGSDRLTAVLNESICTTMGSADDSADWAQLDPDFAAGKKALAAGEWSKAIVALKLAALRDPRNADIQNYIGYAYRQLLQLQPAFTHFQQAVSFNPRHRGAHQHLGEAYLTQGNLAKAEDHLAALERICLLPCEEFRDLKRAIALNSSQRR